MILTQLLLPLALLLALYLLLRGHNLPGGGFIAGLVTAIALMLHYLVQGQPEDAAHWRRRYLWLASSGIALALLTGVASWLFDAAFLTSAFAHWQLPLFGDIELASAMVFDIGVYATVVGATLLILSRLADLSASNEESVRWN